MSNVSLGVPGQTEDLSRLYPEGTQVVFCHAAWSTCLISRSFQAPVVFQCPSLAGQHGTALALLEKHCVDNWRLQLCHLEGERLGNNSHTVFC